MRGATMDCQLCGRAVHFALTLDDKKRVITSAPMTKKYNLLCNDCYHFEMGVSYTPTPIDRAILRT